MCLILFAYKMHPVYKLVVAANRDEFYKRPTAPVHFWEDHPDILAGRDLEKMGTWMGVTKSGRFAALTNYRNPKEAADGKRSRGELVANVLLYPGDLKVFMKDAEKNKHLYPGYNLLAGDSENLYYISNAGGELQRLEPGIYGLSNHLLNTDWPKVKTGKEEMAKIIKGGREELVEQLLGLLQTSDPAPDELLPNTGVPFEMEKMLSPLFIKSDGYGTRSSTIMLMTDADIHYFERVFTPSGSTDRVFNTPILEKGAESRD